MVGKSRGAGGSAATGQRRLGGRRRRDPDQQALARARAGHAGAFDVLRARHEEAVTTFCRGMLERVHAQPEEVVEETFAAARRELPATSGDLQVRPWLYALAFERCVARMNEERERDGAATGSAQGEEQDQRRAAALMTGSLPDGDLVGLMGLAESRPSLFGVAGELLRSAPRSVGLFAAEEAATEAVTALVQAPFGGGGAGSADEAAHQAARSGGLHEAGNVVTSTADRVRRAAMTAAAAGSAVVVAGAGAYALTDAGGSADTSRSTPIVAPVPAGANPAGARLPGGSDTASGRDGSDERSGGGGSGGDRSRGGEGDDPSRGSDGGGDRGEGRDGRDGRDGSSGGGGSSGGNVVRDPTRFLPGGGGGGGGSGDQPSGGGGEDGGEPPPRRRSLLRLALESDLVDAEVEIPSGR